jgi:DNA-binding CsgD family transcriptional regulator
VAEALHCEGDAKAATQTLARLRDAPVQIGYPLIEGELLRRRRAAVVTAADGGEAGDPAGQLGDHALERLRGRAGADGGPRRRLPARRPRRRRRPAARGRARGLWRFGEGFSEVYERAVLRRRLRVERQELRRIASWADGRSAELSDGAIDLARDRQLADAEEGGRPPAARSALHDLLTPREVDVLEHLVKGETNAEIARTLIVSEGTVKFHVKNILRKMNVGNRAEATSQYHRLSSRQET